jgi:hypothetical protein
MKQTPHEAYLLSDFDVPDWIKSFVAEAVKKDPVDVANWTEQVSLWAQARCDALLTELRHDSHAATAAATASSHTDFVNNLNDQLWSWAQGAEHEQQDIIRMAHETGYALAVAQTMIAAFASASEPDQSADATTILTYANRLQALTSSKEHKVAIAAFIQAASTSTS